jgi:hypothetical protein
MLVHLTVTNMTPATTHKPEQDQWDEKQGEWEFEKEERKRWNENGPIGACEGCVRWARVENNYDWMKKKEQYKK